MGSSCVIGETRTADENEPIPISEFISDHELTRNSSVERPNVHNMCTVKHTASARNSRATKDS